MSKTIVQSTIVFKVKGRSKKIIFNGSMHEALVVIREFYPYYCCTEGYTKFIKFESSGDYIITDTLSGNILQQLSTAITEIDNSK